MSTRLVTAIAVLMMAAPPAALAQGKAPPKASKAEVQKLIGTIKGDKTKLAQFCDLTKLTVQAGALAQKNQKDPKLQELSQRMGDIASKLGPDYQKVASSQLDSASVALLDDISASCNVGFKPVQAPPKASKSEVQQLVNNLRSDNAKLAGFCTQTRLANQAGALAQKNPRDPKLRDLKRQMDDIGQQLGADYQRILASDIDNASAALLNDLFKSCK